MSFFQKLRNDYRSPEIHYQVIPYGISSFHSYQLNQFKVIPLACTLYKKPPQIFCDVSRGLFPYCR